MNKGSPLLAALRHPARPVLLAASKSQRLESLSQRFAFTRAVVSRFVAGYELDDALRVVADLLGSRFVSVDHLGENVRDRAQAEAAVQAHRDLLDGLGRVRDELAARGQPLPDGALEASIKLSAFGQLLPDGQALALAGAQALCAKADEVGALVTVDMEDHTTTEATLSVVRALRSDFPWTGAVLQSYLKRTEADCRDFAGPGSRIRLCKGAYQEPKSVAYQDKEQVDSSYKRCLAVLFEGDGYPMVASHDPAMIAEATRLAAATSRVASSYEHQMLYGVRADEQARLAASRVRVRTYVPYGGRWYGYFVRRLAERPANLGFFLRALAGR
ncbi:Proline dehydrogenase [Segniliparus rotundus DSM 44985]|uniref:proline dehydrogenase n=1 Tax=Segniliparus rotundus (strain ATCC BAA-972 / CDC 1076 / CIP 108378 / DSM 44985 / JCM 13578) TaxID=640132 RepID=D6ZD38_SEGRD|nr:proline dehydrogenase family protein [Segniliparus rotundus]ADG99225.1 Proline dehydrogenase [Segniliparus rotundus DSM 44985]